MDTFKKDNLKLSPDGDKWQLVEFTLHNEFVNNATILNLFDVNNQTPIPTQASSGAPSITATINAPARPTGIAYNPVNNCMYVCNRNTFPTPPQVSVIDCATNTVTSTILILGDPVQIAYDAVNNRMYLTSDSNDKVFVINCATNAVIGTSIAVGVSPQGIAYNSSDGTMYVCNSGSADVTVINCSTNTVVGTTISVGTQPSFIAYDVANDRMYVTNLSSDNVSVINCSTATVISTISVGTQPQGIAYNSNNNTMYVVHNSSDNIYIIDCATNTVVGSPIPLTFHGQYIAYNPLTNIMYATNNSNSVDIINCSTNTLAYNVVSGSAILGIAYNSIDDTAYFCEVGADSVSVIDQVQLFFITGTWDYNQFLRDLSVNPKLVRQIVFVASSTQLAQPIQLAYKDFYGISWLTPRYPSLNITPYMPQIIISEMDFDYKNMELVFDSTHYISNYQVAANTSMVLLIYYKELILSNMLEVGATLLSCNKIDVENCSEDNVSKTEKELAEFGEPIITIDEFLNLETNAKDKKIKK